MRAETENAGSSRARSTINAVAGVQSCHPPDKRRQHVSVAAETCAPIAALVCGRMKHKIRRRKMTTQTLADPRHTVRSPVRPANWLTLATLCMAVLIAQVDTCVTNLATRPIGATFHSGVGALQWVVDAYNLAYAVLLLTGGLLADLYGRRLVFMVGAGIFTAASLICAVAPSIGILIAGRALTGVGAAMLLPASLAVIRVAWPDPKTRGHALGIWTGCNGLGIVLGPTIGGVLIEAYGWRSVFLVVVPLGVLAVALAVYTITESADPKGRRFDAAAQVLGIVALGGLALAAIESQGSRLLAVIAFIAAIIALGAFIRVEWVRGQAALVPLDIVRIPTFRATAIATTGMTFGMYGMLFVRLLDWQSNNGFTALQAGLALVPMAIVYILVSPFSGLLQEKLGTRFATGGGVAIIGSGLLTLGATSTIASVIPAEIGLMLCGLGMGIATGPLTGAAIGAVAPARSGTASALINVARMVGATVGVAVLGAVYALAGRSAEGVMLAMLLGGAVQVLSALVCWRSMGMLGRSAAQ
jgi:EmrB/QacA subfamily drug resistance transporter